MEPEEVIPAPSGEGLTADTVPQATPPVSQETVEPQKPDIAPVESNDNKPQAQEPPRRRPSDYYRERENSRFIRDSLTTQNKRIEELFSLFQNGAQKKPDGPQTSSKFDPIKFWNDPDSVLSEREQRLLREIEGLKENFSQFQNGQRLTERQRNEQEALELLFPKASPDSEETLEARIQSNPDRFEKVDQLLRATGLDDFSRINPKAAAKLALKFLEEKQQATSPKVISKALMGGAARGNPAGAAKGSASLESLMTELKKLGSDAETNSSLRADDKWRSRRGQLMQEIDRLVKEKRD